MWGRFRERHYRITEESFSLNIFHFNRNGLGGLNEIEKKRQGEMSGEKQTWGDPRPMRRHMSEETSRWAFRYTLRELLWERLVFRF